ncbi:MAG: tRNA epoxyqueuosine(34) reductase QueG [Methylococcaceae bacterium]|nr:MAG: tRNA epoxyqueuosine(34) reductase QueG [Methylococcaceae bacterium]
MNGVTTPDYPRLAELIKTWGKTLGFQGVGIAGIDLSQAEQRLSVWLAQGLHGEMDYMQRHGAKRSRPEQLVPGTLRVISARMDYLPHGLAGAAAVLSDSGKAYVSRYALGRDYHKLLRQRLQKLAKTIEDHAGPFGYRVFCDSAPVLEKPLAQHAGLGWIGKHTNLIAPRAGSWFFLGEIYTDLPLPTDTPSLSHCGTCRACLEVCPTQAIIAPYLLDARRCISYLTIELAGAIPPALRPAIGNRIYGCDDCQLVCPWNRFAQLTRETDFLPRHALEASNLVDLFAWDEAEFLRRSEGSPIRRIGHERWLRNLAVALGNAAATPATIAALLSRRDHPSAMVREHVDWALQRHDRPAGATPQKLFPLSA